MYIDLMINGDKGAINEKNHDLSTGANPSGTEKTSF